MKNRIFCILAVSFILLSGCQSPDNIEIPIDIQGLTRITAKFTSGDYNEQIAGEIIITDMTTDTYVIPVPWYYPEESYNETTPYMEAMKVEATLANNYLINIITSLTLLFQYIVDTLIVNPCHQIVYNKI